jgi:hypothetical protein
MTMTYDRSISQVLDLNLNTSVTKTMKCQFLCDTQKKLYNIVQNCRAHNFFTDNHKKIK